MSSCPTLVATSSTVSAPIPARSSLDRRQTRSESPRPCLRSRPRRFSQGSRIPVLEEPLIPLLPLNLARIDDVHRADSLVVYAPPSPNPTEVDAPASEDLTRKLLQRGIKIRDFAYAAPYVSSHSNPASPIADIGASPTPIPAPKRITEIFDPYKGLTEVDYWCSQTIRRHPITGKTLRRLLDMGWLSVDDLTSRGHRMDFEALEAFDKYRATVKEANGGVDTFPFHTLGAKDKPPPTVEDRRLLFQHHMRMWKQYDRILTFGKDKEEMNRALNEEGERMKEVLAESQREREKKKAEESERERKRKRRGKRRQEEDADIDYRRGEGESEDPASSSSGSKRIKLSPSEDGASTHRLLPPKKQYPAPLRAYDPKLYPDAANIIASSSRSRPSLPERSDTPPALDRTDTPPSVEGDGRYNAQKLVHPKKTRGLTRTQTIMELF